MVAVPIRFGTSGWRGLIAQDFTFSRVRLVARAIAWWLRERTAVPRVLVGYDRRFFSEEFAQAAAEVLAAEGVEVLLSQAPLPTPAVAVGVVSRQLEGGINITASHNPAEYSGLKFTESNGAPCSVEQASEIERRIAYLLDRPEPVRRRQQTPSALTRVDCRSEYLERLEKLVACDRIRAAGVRVIYDAMHGCGADYLDRFLREHGVSVETLRAERDVLFGGHPPDPAAEHLSSLRGRLAEASSEALVVGLATDGDADRFGVVDAGGQFISPNHVLALLFDYLIVSRNWRRGVARSVATTHLLDRVAAFYGLPAYQTPVGFKYVGRYLLTGQVALAGEESAGLSVYGHVPEKDGVLAGLLVAEMVAERGPLAHQRQELFRRLGVERWPLRWNLPLRADMAARLQTWMNDPPERFLAYRVQAVDRTDGVKLLLDDDCWLLVRSSGTEAQVRIYAEADSLERTRQLLEGMRQWLLG